MKNDARVRYTKRVLREALLECLREKSIKETTVKEICERAGVNRATFYKHYRDCYDLLEQTEEDELEQFRQVLSENSKLGEQVTACTLDILERNESLNEILIKAGLGDSLRAKMLALAHDYCIDEWKKQMPRASEQEVEMLFSALSAAVFHIIFGEYGRYDRETIIRFTNSLIANSARPYM